MKNWIADGTFTGQDADELLDAIDRHVFGERDWDGDDIMTAAEEEFDAHKAEFESCTNATDCGCPFCSTDDPFADV